MQTLTSQQSSGIDFAAASESRDLLQGARILFLVEGMHSISDGGTERQLLQMIDICNRAGMLPELCVLRDTRWLTPEIAGCPVKRFNVEKIGSWRGMRSLIQLAQWMRAQQFDILQSIFYEANLIAPVAGRLAGVPIILGTRRNLNHPRNGGPNRLGLMAQAAMNLFVDNVIANSHAVLERIVESEFISRKRICVVYNGIDLEQMRPSPELRELMRKALGLKEDHILVGNVSGLRSIKGVKLFVDAAARSYQSDRRLRFALVGDGEMKSELEQTIQNYGLADIVHLTGAAEDVRPYLAAFDIAVLCSYAEGFSNSLLEYMACGLPAIATDVGGNREALAECGLLVRTDAEELANAIQAMCAPQVRQHFAAAALERVKSFDVSFAHERMIKIYAHYLNTISPKKRSDVQIIAHPLDRSL